MDGVGTPFLIYLLMPLSFELACCWACWYCLDMKRFPLFFVIHMASQALAIFLRYFGLHTFYSDLLLWIGIYFILPAFFLNKFSGRYVLSICVITVGVLVYGFSASIMMYIISGDPNLPFIDSYEQLPYLALCVFSGDVMYMLFILLFKKFMKNTMEAAIAERLPFIALCVFQIALGVTICIWGTLCRYSLSIEFILCFFMMSLSCVIGFAIAATRQQELTKQLIQQNELEETVSRMQEEDEQATQSILLLRALKHDMNNQISVASTMAAEGNIDEAIAALERIKGKAQKLEDSYAD